MDLPEDATQTALLAVFTKPSPSSPDDLVSKVKGLLENAPKVRDFLACQLNADLKACLCAQLGFSAAVLAARFGMQSTLAQLIEIYGIALGGASATWEDCAFCVTCEPVGLSHQHWAPHDCASRLGLIHAAAAGGHEDIVISCIAAGSPVDITDSVRAYSHTLCMQCVCVCVCACVSVSVSVHTCVCVCVCACVCVFLSLISVPVLRVSVPCVHVCCCDSVLLCPSVCVLCVHACVYARAQHFWSECYQCLCIHLIHAA